MIEGDAIAIRSQAHLALTFDHRLIDGALADQFCQKVKVHPRKLVDKYSLDSLKLNLREGRARSCPPFQLSAHVFTWLGWIERFKPIFTRISLAFTNTPLIWLCTPFFA